MVYCNSNHCPFNNLKAFIPCSWKAVCTMIVYHNGPKHDCVQVDAWPKLEQNRVDVNQLRSGVGLLVQIQPSIRGGPHDDVIKWKHFPRYWPFVRGIHRSPVNSPHKGQWRGALMFSLICAWINEWVNNREAGDLRRHRAHNDVILKTKFLQV